MDYDDDRNLRLPRDSHSRLGVFDGKMRAEGCMERVDSSVVFVKLGIETIG